MKTDSQNMNELIKYIKKKYPNKVHSAVKVDPKDADKLEHELGLKLPQSYRSIVNEFGTLSVMSNQFLGTPDNPESTLDYRKWHPSEFPHSYIIVYEIGDGSVFCIDTAREVDGDNPVVFWDAIDYEHIGSKNFASFVVETIWEELLEEGYDVSEIEHLRPANPGWNNAV